MKAVLINTPWAQNRLKSIAEWWGLDFVFDRIAIIDAHFIPMQAIPTSDISASLDMELVNREKHNFTVFVAPFVHPPQDKNGNTLAGRVSCNGIYLPSVFSFYRNEWFVTRLFWRYPVIQVFANENDVVQVDGRTIGKAFEIWANHEFSHFLYQVIQKKDKTHEYFYAGKPELAREEVLAILKK